MCRCIMKFNMPEISLDKSIANGRTADVYEWDEKHVIKLFHDWFGLEDIEYELRIARAVHASGVKTPAVKELIQVEGRNGLIYERVNGKSMVAIFHHKPWLVFSYSRALARLHVEMHDCVFNAEVPHQQDKLRNKIDHANTLPSSLKNQLLTELASLPRGDRVCHGDFHPANVLIARDGAIVIDWIDAARGNPLADVARTTIIFLGSANTTQTPNPIIKMFTKLSHTVYLREYFRLRPDGQDEYHHWLPIVAAGRLTEGMPELEKWLVKQAEKTLTRAAKGTNT